MYTFVCSDADSFGVVLFVLECDVSGSGLIPPPPPPHLPMKRNLEVTLFLCAAFSRFLTVMPSQKHTTTLAR